ncbi:hypothetical protein [Pseudomonas frederiksbergensis]|uniref:Uncharacterized protein n=1 Tax=Pseudomonas frederiksbergensis TaxID=104087 RepID=A0A423JGI1_9PSED|nr:hypothetical protein [Pseudomonas frederiksbergensis]RON36793.1 hypothetical protein BK661_00010 [Pseudomonas frederiksbergensis]
MEEHAFTLPKPAESGFHIVQTPMTLEALERSLFEITPSDVLRREFRSLNRHLGERVKPGQMVIFSDSRNYMCGREEAQMMAAAEKVNEALKDLTDEEASFMVERHEVIEPFLPSQRKTLRGTCLKPANSFASPFNKKRGPSSAAFFCFFKNRRRDYSPGSTLSNA